MTGFDFDIRAEAAESLTPERERIAREWARDYLDANPLLTSRTDGLTATTQMYARDILRFGAALDEARRSPFWRRRPSWLLARHGSPALAAASRAGAQR